MYDDVPARLLQSIYRALDDDVEWREILEQFVTGFDADMGSMGIVEGRGDQRQTYTELAESGGDRGSYRPPGSLLGKLSSDDETPSSVQLPAILETQHHPDNGLYEVHAGGWLSDESIVLVELRRREPFDDSDCRKIRQLTEHLGRVVRTRRDLRRIRDIEQQNSAPLEALRVPAAVVDRSCVVMAKNRLFQQVLERGALRVSADNRVKATRSGLTERLRENVSDIVDAIREQPEVEGASELSVVLDARPHDPTTIVASPVVRADRGKPHVLLSIYHPDADHRIDQELLEQLYDFTPTEAQTAARLAEGYTIDEIADYRRCARSTVRTHVKRILQKTGTHRQAELVRVILGSPAAKLAAWGA